jgi:hypothetical protein
MGNFLEDLKKSVETGEFNSEAAKKIIEVSKLADEKAKGNAFKMVQDRLEKAGYNDAIPEEERIELNSEYEQEMEKIKKQDAENKRIADLTNLADKQIALLIEMNDMVMASITDMMSFVTELEEKFKKEIEDKNPIFISLTQEIAKIKNKYNITNN